MYTKGGRHVTLFSHVPLNILLLLQGLKLQYGHVPLYVRGDDSKSKQFTSLHGVQRHMVDANKCKMAFDDNEEEYLEFYDWSQLEDELTGTCGLRSLALPWLLSLGLPTLPTLYNCICISWYILQILMCMCS